MALDSPWASAHVHVCMIHSFTATPQVRKMTKKLGTNQLGHHCQTKQVSVEGVSFAVLVAVWWRTLTQQVSSSDCCWPLVKHYPSPPTVSLLMPSGNIIMMRLKGREKEMRWWDGGRDEASGRWNGSEGGHSGSGEVNHRVVNTWRQQIRRLGGDVAAHGLACQTQFLC